MKPSIIVIASILSIALLGLVNGQDDDYDEWLDASEKYVWENAADLLAKQPDPFVRAISIDRVIEIKYQLVVSIYYNEAFRNENIIHLTKY